MNEFLSELCHNGVVKIFLLTELMSQSSVNNKRIAKNTLFLYFRTLCTMAMSLYTSRVILSTLGVNDFGIYNVVGGIVMFLSFLNTSMASATQRFLNVELGRNNLLGVKCIFSNALIIHFIISLLVVLLAETVGVWFLNCYMNIVPERLDAANFVLQFSIATMVTTIISVPYNAVIIANEKMSAFAYISIIEVTLKLFLALLLVFLPGDKLIVYAMLMFFVSLIIRFLYGIYCTRNFDECKNYKLKPNKKIIRQMMSFSMWTVVGALASIGHGQGVSIVMNLFFGVVVNAAFGIANQVNQVVSNFVNNFMTAINPQIVKTYSSDDLIAMHDLVSKGCRMGFFLVLLITLLNSFASPLSAAQGATGNIRNYQIVLTIVGLLHIPLAWLCFSFGLNPNYAMYVYIVIVLLEQSYRIFFVSHSISMPFIPFVRTLLIRCGSVACLAFLLSYFLHECIPDGIVSSFFICGMGVLSVAVLVYVFGLKPEEKHGLLVLVKAKINKI